MSVRGRKLPPMKREIAEQQQREDAGGEVEVLEHQSSPSEESLLATGA